MLEVLCYMTVNMAQWALLHFEKIKLCCYLLSFYIKLKRANVSFSSNSEQRTLK